MLIIKQKSPSFHRNMAPGTFGELQIVFSIEKSAMPPLFNGPEALSSASDKAKLSAKTFFKNLDDSGISLPVFPSRTNLKLHNFSVTQKKNLGRP